MNSEARESSSPTVGTAELHSVLRDYMEVTQRLQKTHETLQREVVRLRNEVESKDRELERRRRLASLGELAAGVAHEVRNPLGAIRLYNGLLRNQLGDHAAAIELIERIDSGIHAIDCIVQDTLALAPPGGKLTRRALRAIVDSAHEACRATFAARRVACERHYEHPELEVFADAAALQRVFVNLLTNAAQASPERGKVIVRVRKRGDEHLEVRVADDGPGLPEEIIDKIFDPFFTTKEDGTGLGLTIVHRLVEAHGGNLAAGNRQDGGAEFVVVLPTSGGGNEENGTLDGGTEQTSAA